MPSTVCVDIITPLVLSHLTVPSCALTISPVVESRGWTLLIVTLAPTPATAPATTTIIIIIAFPCVLQRMVKTERVQRNVAKQLMLDAVACFSRTHCPSRGEVHWPGSTIEQGTATQETWCRARCDSVGARSSGQSSGKMIEISRDFTAIARSSYDVRRTRGEGKLAPSSCDQCLLHAPKTLPVHVRSI